MTSTGEIILTDFYNDRLIILKEDGSFNYDIRLSYSHPADVTCINERTVAVSFKGACCIEIIDLIYKTKTRIIKTNTYCSGISNRQGFLFYAEHENGIYSVQLQNGGKCSLILKNDIKHWDYLTLSDDRITQYITKIQYVVMQCQEKKYGNTVISHY